jgi:hypothetical protein
MVAREREIDEQIDTGQLEPWEADNREPHADPQK